MSTMCDLNATSRIPTGLCPRCGYQNGPGAQRCVRCRSVLAVPKGCSGSCAKCLVPVPNPKEVKADG